MIRSGRRFGQKIRDRLAADVIDAGVVDTFAFDFNEHRRALMRLSVQGEEALFDSLLANPFFLR